MRPIDVEHLGTERVICCWQVGELLIDPGPESSVHNVIAALGDRIPRAILLTHIHLDHAGGTGALVRRWPDVQVYVHELGAPHLVDPSKLIASATRLYGADMERLWGEIVPLPAANVHPLRGGEAVEGFRVEHTPGHASHHVCYLHESSGWCFVGDMAGVRIAPARYVKAPTTPPEFDLDAWLGSVDAIESWRPVGLAMTHFGAAEDVDWQLRAVREWLLRWTERARELGSERAFADALAAEQAAALDPEMLLAYGQAAGAELLYAGLERYWRKRAETV